MNLSIRLFIAILTVPFFLSAVDPFAKCNDWFLEEKTCSTVWHHLSGVLSTISKDFKAQGRIVDVLKVDSRGALFFTHANTEKVKALSSIPSSSLNIWLPEIKRQLTISGNSFPVSREECLPYWKRFPRHMQLMFMSSDHVSAIESLEPLRERFNELSSFYGDEIPMPDEFVGYRLEPEEMIFYEVQTKDFAVKHLYKRGVSVWTMQLMAP